VADTIHFTYYLFNE